MEYVIIIGKNVNLESYNYTNKTVIGVDKGALSAILAGIPLAMAIGDFDSVSEEEYALIKKNTRIIKLNPCKDNTDTKEALKLCQDAEKIVILGGIQGKRIEHFIANLILLINDEKIELLDDNTHIYTRDKNFQIKKGKYKYLSFFAIKESILSLNGVKYPLKDYLLKSEDTLAVSNEITEEYASVLLDGRVLVIESVEDRENIFEKQSNY